MIALCLIESLGAFGSCKWTFMDRFQCPQVASLNTGIYVPFYKGCTQLWEFFSGWLFCCFFVSFGFVFSKNIFILSLKLYWALAAEVGEDYAMWHKRQKVVIAVVVDQVWRVAFPKAWWHCAAWWREEGGCFKERERWQRRRRGRK